MNDNEDKVHWSGSNRLVKKSLDHRGRRRFLELSGVFFDLFHNRLPSQASVSL